MRLNRELRIFAVLSISASCVVVFQNCGSGYNVQNSPISSISAVSNASDTVPSTPLCAAGTYATTANGSTGMILIDSVSASGNFTGTFANPATYSISGNCVNGAIDFTLSGSGVVETWAGTYTASNAMSGTFTYAGVSTYQWSANLLSSQQAAALAAQQAAAAAAAQQAAAAAAAQQAAAAAAAQQAAAAAAAQQAAAAAAAAQTCNMVAGLKGGAIACEGGSLHYLQGPLSSTLAQCTQFCEQSKAVSCAWDPYNAYDCLAFTDPTCYTVYAVPGYQDYVGTCQ
jgi:hypothetical protein